MRKKLYIYHLKTQGMFTRVYFENFFFFFFDKKVYIDIEVE